MSIWKYQRNMKTTFWYFYAWKQYEEKQLFSLSDEQRSQLEEVRDKLTDYSLAGFYLADLWLETANELLN